MQYVYQPPHSTSCPFPLSSFLPSEVCTVCVLVVSTCLQNCCCIYNVLFLVKDTAPNFIINLYHSCLDDEYESECPICAPENRKVLDIIRRQMEDRDMHEQFQSLVSEICYCIVH